MAPALKSMHGWGLCLQWLFVVVFCSFTRKCSAPDPSSTCIPQAWSSSRFPHLLWSPAHPSYTLQLRLAGGGGAEEGDDAFGFEKVTSLDPPRAKKVPQPLKPRKKRARKDIKGGVTQDEDDHQHLADLFASSEDTESDSMDLSALANHTQALLSAEFPAENVDKKGVEDGRNLLGTDALIGQTPMETDEVPETTTTSQISSSGTLIPSPIVALRGHKDVTLEHFRMERIAFDKDGKALPKHTYRWRGTLVRVELDKKGRKQRLVDLVRDEVVHRYATKTRVFLRGHSDATLEDFPLERRPTDMMGVYRWRDREVRVVVEASGKIDRIVDTEDGSNVFIFDEEDTQAGLLQNEMLDPELFKLDRQAATLRLARLAEGTMVEDDGPPFGPTQIVWPQEIDGVVEHGCTLIWLHGMGGSADLSVQVAERLDMRWCKFIFLGAPLQPVSVLNGSVTTSWFDIDTLNEKEASEDDKGLERSVEYVCSIIQDEILCAIPPRQIALAGVGQGAAVAFSAALRTFRWTETVGELGLEAESMEKIAAVACLSGWMPKSAKGLQPAWSSELRPTYWKGNKVGKRGGVELMVAHGKQDEVVPYKLGRRLFKTALKMGFSAAEMHKYEMGHGICGREFIDLQIFLHRILPSPVLSMQQMFGMPRVPWTLSQLAPMDMDLLEPAKAPPPTDAGAMERLRQLQKAVL